MLSRKVLVYVLCLIAAATALAEPGTYTVQRTSGPITIDGLIDEADWESAPSFTPFVFPWWTAGAKEQTEVKMLWDDEFLYIAYRCEDAHIWAEYYDSNSATCLDDCVELFWNPAPDKQGGYYMFEMNCIGNVLSVCNDRSKPILENKTLPPHMGQTITGTLNNDSDTDTGWTMEVAVRFTDYNTLAEGRSPRDGDTWRINLNRCGGKTNEQYSQWVPHGTPKPNFHVPDDFGEIVFSAKPVK